jgi:hypothetical protein
VVAVIWRPIVAPNTNGAKGRKLSEGRGREGNLERERKKGEREREREREREEGRTATTRRWFRISLLTAWFHGKMAVSFQCQYAKRTRNYVNYS